MITNGIAIGSGTMLGRAMWQCQECKRWADIDTHVYVDKNGKPTCLECWAKKRKESKNGDHAGFCKEIPR